MKRVAAGITGVVVCLIMAGAENYRSGASASIQLGGGRGIGFDDMGFAPALDRILVPGGRTGMLFLIDPGSKQFESIGGFSSSSGWQGGHGEGITSADAGPGLIFVTDRTSRMVDLVDSHSHRIVASAKLASGPDYVRYVGATNEIWVTEPRAARIEIFALHGSAAPTHSGFVAVPGGPESLAIDGAAGRAYTNEWTDKTLAIDVKRRAIVARWANGCRGARGIALDSARSLVLVGCEEGKLSVLNTGSGRLLGQIGSAAGVDIIAYNAALHHVYVPGADSGSINIIDLSDPNSPHVVGAIPSTAKGTHCAAADDRNGVYVCDPGRGQILYFQDRATQ